MELTGIFPILSFSLKADFLARVKEKKKKTFKIFILEMNALAKINKFSKIPWRKNNPWSIAGSQGLILEISSLVDRFPACF